jgi:ABC-type amino acid transport substrate-binding protein
MSPVDVLSHLSLPLVLSGVSLLGLCSYLFYLWWDNRVFDAQLPPLKVGIPDEHTTMFSSNARGFFQELVTLVGRRLRRRVRVVPLPAAKLESALHDGAIDIMCASSDHAFTNEAALEKLSCYSTNTDSLSLVFWDRMPSQVSSLQDYVYYPSNSTIVMRDSFEDQYVSTFNGVEVHRADSLNDFIIELKTGLVRSGLVLSRYVHSLRAEYPNLKAVQVAGHKRCLVHNELLCVPRKNHSLVLQLDHRLAQMHEDKTIRQLQKKWFSC